MNRKLRRKSYRHRPKLFAKSGRSPNSTKFKVTTVTVDSSWLDMPTFPSNPVHSSPIHSTLRKYPGLFGIPFLILIVGASFGLQSFTQTRYDLHDQKVTQVRQSDV